MTAFKPLQIASAMRGGDVDVSELSRRLEEYDRNNGAILDRGIRFSDNCDMALIAFTSSGTPDAENTVAHTLGKIPEGFIVTNINKGAVVYTGGTAWTKTNLYLKCNVATTIVTAWIF